MPVTTRSSGSASGEKRKQKPDEGDAAAKQVKGGERKKKTRQGGKNTTRNDMLPNEDKYKQRIAASESTLANFDVFSAAKRQRVAVVESALTNVDVVGHLAAFLDAADLCQVKATCKALGSTNDGAEFNGLSMVDEAARRFCESASDEEKAMLPRYEGESWIELYHHLLMLRSPLTFDQLVGRYVEYRGDNKAVVQGKKINGGLRRYSQAICGDHVMRAGKHWATLTSTSSFDCYRSVGVIRPLPGWDKRGLETFYPDPPHHSTRRNLQHERTASWRGDVHYLCISMSDGSRHWSDWEGNRREIDIDDWEGFDDNNKECVTLGMLLDLGSGTLSVFRNGRRLGTLKDGLAGEYCWTVGFCGRGNVSIQRGYNEVIV
ncbi:hypothetical protein THAOC_14695 [Thalassiosira oceanica]|uniref:B30.2/SPRY domain-containing protein n=1 Tax=Thalassiosira oceanica TaxID=159749 RepID=K0T275_THAOC|nr:hypothetical protein THAOC_14695 [Thalassiosira oceanica]|eukprot:EJK64562.1 hypothetical protein THAOC_14695 [Thalassiosira oceanica]